jgi:hypothetical protein
VPSAFSDEIHETVLDKRGNAPRIRAPMHSNYLIHVTGRAFIALPQRPILSNRAGALACAPRDERNFGGLS